MNAKVLVIGATGVLGREVVRQLAEKNVSIRVGVRHPEKYATSTSSPVEALTFDFDKPSSFAGALAGIEQMFLIARPLDPDAPAVLAPVIQAAKQAGVKHIVFNSVIGAELNESSPLRQVELLIEKSGIEYTFLRPNFFMENFSHGFLAPTIKEVNSIFVAAEKGKTSFISTMDIAAVAVAALTSQNHVGKAYNLTGAQALDHYEVADILSTICQRKITYNPITEEEMIRGALESGMPQATADYLAVLYQVTRAGYVAAVTNDVEAVLGRKPVSFTAFAQKRMN